MSIIVTNNVSKSYGAHGNQKQILENVSLAIEQGESVAIVGKSGSGKSTLMNILSGLTKEYSGEVTVSDKDLKKIKNTSKFRNQNIGFIFQSFNLQPHNTVFENVFLPKKIRGVFDSKDVSEVDELLYKLGLEELRDKKTQLLSGGQKQRVAIARCLVNNPEVIFADEPTGNLDSKTGSIIIDLLFDMQKKLGTTLIIVTHDRELATKCDRIIEIVDGRITTKK